MLIFTKIQNFPNVFVKKWQKLSSKKNNGFVCQDYLGLLWIILNIYNQINWDYLFSLK
jgi:hypothetical protein